MLKINPTIIGALAEIETQIREEGGDFDTCVATLPGNKSNVRKPFGRLLSDRNVRVKVAKLCCSNIAIKVRNSSNSRAYAKQYAADDNNSMAFLAMEGLARAILAANV